MKKRTALLVSVLKPNHFIKIIFILFAFLFQLNLVAQETKKKHIPGTSCTDCEKNNTTQKSVNPTVQNGNASLGINYNNTACGLNYVQGSVVIQQRAPSAGLFTPPPGATQPAPIVISGIPVCAIILKAYLYADASGNGVPITTTVTNPGGASASYPMPVIGTDIDKCWFSVGYSATYSYRADVTSIITTNGTYQVSGLPVYPAPGPNDVDGATLVIIYSDPSAGYTGTLIITDGAQTDGSGSGLSGNITGFTACGNSTSGSSFILLADLQQLAPTPITINGSTSTLATASDLWWNCVQSPFSIASGQNSCAYSVTNGSDCFNIVAIGMYFQTACNVCTATSLTVTASSVSSCVGNTATAVVTGGSGSYSYTWTPSGGNAATTTNIPGGTYTVTVTDNAGCKSGTATVTVASSASPILTVNSPSICNGNSTTLTVSGATTYTWSPATGLSSTSGASVTANPSVTTTYTITGAIGPCSGTITSVVTVNPLPTINVTSGSVCNGASAPLTASGASTYTWSPATGLSSTTGANVNANPASTTSYTVTGTDINGCVNTGTTTVVVVTNPIVTVNSATICNGNSATITANGAATYAWSPATGLSSTVGTSVTANPVVTTIYTVTGSVGTCTAVNTTTVTVNPLPVITIGSNSPVCVNQSLNLTSTGGPGYAWSGPSGFSSTLQNPTIAGVTTAATGTYSLVVTDANSCVSSASVAVIVNSLPVVAVTGATVCIGATINLTANGGTGYSWSGPGLYTSNAQNPSIPNATIAMSGNYVVTVTDANGCVNANVAMVTVNPSLVINATNNGPICQNATLVLSATSGISWNWSGPGGFVSFSQNPSIPNAQVGNSGTYTVVGTDANGCLGTAMTTVIVNPLPTVTVNSSTICVTQQTATLTANGASTYNWTPSTGLSSSNGNPVTANPMVTLSYTVMGTDANNCVNFATATVTVNQLPNISATSGVICLGNSCVLNANGAVAYTWNPSAGLSSAVGSPVTASPASSTNYTVTGTDANGCFNNGLCSVTVNPLPVVTVNSGTICINKSTVLTANGANAYSWSPVTGLSSSTGNPVTANPSSTITYSVIGTDLNGCKDTVTTTVTVNPLPVLSVGPQTTSGCEPLCVNLANTNTVTTGTCSWNFGDGSTSTSCAPTHCFTGQGTFFPALTLTDANGCISTSSVTVIVFPVPNADFNATPQPTTILDNAIHFYDYSTGAIISAWNWNLGNGTLSTTQNPICLYGDTGSFAAQLVVISDHGCRDSIIKIIKIADEFMLYVPNAFTPNYDGTNDFFMAKGEGIKDFKMWIFDRWGNQIFYSEDIYIGWDGRYLSKGNIIVQEDVYVWKITCKNTKGEPNLLKGIVSLIK